MLTAPRMVRIERAVRPCLPITLPTSSGATRSLRTVFSSRSTLFTSTAAGSSTRARAISRTSSSTSTISCWVMLLPLTGCVQELATPNSRPKSRDLNRCAHSISTHPSPSAIVCAPAGQMPAHTATGEEQKTESGHGGFCNRRRVLGHQLRDDRGQLRAHAAPVGDALVLQIHRGRLGARVVGADDLDRTAVAGAVLLDDHATVVGRSEEHTSELQA